MSFLPPGHTHEPGDNPYLAPKAVYGERPLHLRGAELSQFQIGEIFSKTWNIYKAQMGLCIAVPIVGGIVVAGTYFALVILFVALGASGIRSPIVIGLSVVVGFLGLAILALWITAGIVLFYLNLAKGRQAGFADLLAAGRHLIPYLVATIVAAIIQGLICGFALFVPAVFAYSLTGPDSPARVGSIVVGVCLAVVFSIVFWLRVSQYQYLIFDDKAGALESLRLSSEVTRGKTLEILVIFLLTIPISTAGVLACGIGQIFTMPFCYLLLAVTYLAVTGQPIADPSAPYLQPVAKPIADDDFV